MIKRDPRSYGPGFEDEPEIKPFYLCSLLFDGKQGDYNTGLIDAFNSFLQENKTFSDYWLVPYGSGGQLPEKIVVINATEYELPTSNETARIFEEYFSEKGLKIQVKVVNTHQELMEEVEQRPEKVMIVSQCADKNVYDVDIAAELETRGIITVPGRITAPGSVFSDKDSTYRLLSDGGKTWDEVARYEKIPVEGKSVEEVVEDIISMIDRLAVETGDDVFFVKPHEGGGGLGGFRVTKRGSGYIIPDLSKVSGVVSVIHPTYIHVEVNDTAKLRELLWIYRLFATDEKMKSNYLLVDLPIVDTDEGEALQVLRDYLESCEEKRERKLSSMCMGRDEVKRKLIEAVNAFEKKYKRRYIPLVNEHIDFGFWGLRAHYRLSGKGPKLETIYSRIFQLAFTEEGVGYVGSDNISNQQTGEVEILRLGPVNKIMVEAIGGKEVLFNVLLKGAQALVDLAGLLPEEERRRVPIRVQLDLATLSQRIGEGNADTARGMCLASRWAEFVRNNREWLEDSLAYYAWKKAREVG